MSVRASVSLSARQYDHLVLYCGTLYYLTIYKANNVCAFSLRVFFSFVYLLVIIFFCLFCVHYILYFNLYVCFCFFIYTQNANTAFIHCRPMYIKFIYCIYSMHMFVFHSSIFLIIYNQKNAEQRKNGKLKMRNSTFTSRICVIYSKAFH